MMPPNYEARYAADMRAQGNDELCRQAGVALIRNTKDMWYWKRGDVHSGEVFDTKDESAAAFVRSDEFHKWLRSRSAP